MSQSILITGVSGHLGSGVLDHLLTLLPADRLIALARDPKKIERYAAKGVTIRQGDFNDRASLDRAFSGVHTVLLIPTIEMGQRQKQSQNVVDAAKDAGVQHILFTGVVHHNETGHGPVVSDHQDTERIIETSRLSHTFIRNGLYLDVLPMLLGNAQESGVFGYPTAEHGLTVALRADLAEATAKIIANTSLQGGIIELGSTKPVFFPDVANALSKVIGKPVVHANVSYDEHRSSLLGTGLPEPVAEVFVGMARSIAEGVITTNNGRLQEILGREPVSAETFLRTTLQPAHA